ncbi:MAG: energy transducer TonB [Bacteroidales bacterium]|nr:energy transducer TonB [Bacteroidales bacterium]MCF8456058.1 energy transducer TonB [Bacteroidales bacterium]
MKKPNKEKKFLNLPTYPGGKDALDKFLAANIQYPDEARQNNIQGIVHISFDVDHYGAISNEQIIHPLGHGCDEEAIRVVRLLKFNKTYNRGMRVKKKMKFRIPFPPPLQSAGFSYEYKEDKTSTPPENEKKKDEPSGYGYTINF